VAYKAIIDMVPQKRNSVTQTWVARTTGKHATNRGTMEDMMEHTLVRLIKSNLKNWKIKLCIIKKQLSVDT
jgi:hypothetical protein